MPDSSIFIRLQDIWQEFGYPSFERAKAHSNSNIFPVQTFKVAGAHFMDREIARIYFLDTRLEAARELVASLEAAEIVRELKEYEAAVKKLPVYLR